MEIKTIQRVGAFVLVGALLYTGFQGVINFYSGFHALDTAFNFIQLGYVADTTTNGIQITLKEAYRLGLNKMLSGFGWICFDVILALFSGALLIKSMENKK